MTCCRAMPLYSSATLAEAYWSSLNTGWSFNVYVIARLHYCRQSLSRRTAATPFRHYLLLSRHYAILHAITHHHRPAAISFSSSAFIFSRRHAYCRRQRRHQPFRDDLTFSPPLPAHIEPRSSPPFATPPFRADCVHIQNFINIAASYYH